jgi:WD40 repeat protein
MRSHPILALASVSALLIALAAPAGADDAAKPKVNYKDNVAGFFQSKCNACHNAGTKKGGLALDTYSGVMQGGGSGAVVEAGDPDNSRLYLLCAHEEEPKMPPNAAKLPDADLATLKAWIEAGAPETSGSVIAMKAKPKVEFKLDPASIGKPQGPPAMPESVLTEVVLASPRPNAVVAMAASPWAPLVAIGGHKQVLLYNTQTKHLCGVLPFPEGTIYCLKFSRDGGILLAGGGRGAEKGLAVAFDVKTGNRLFEVGKEYDIVLACDISPDRSTVALGGPSRLVRVYNSNDGELAFECKKHTEWVTAIAFSPDGALLASGDRNGGLVVWEGATGREFHDLRNHSAMITGLSWRLDSNLLASSSEDGSVRLWEMENGGNIKGWGAHGGGALAVAFLKDGRLVSTGRDRVTKLWDQNGGAKKQYEGFGDVGLQVVPAFDDASVIAADWSGEVRIYKTDDGARLGNLVANPPTLATRIEQATQAVAAAQAAIDPIKKAIEALTADAQAKAAALTAATQAQAAAEAAAAKASADLQAAEAAVAPAAAALQQAQGVTGALQAPAQQAAALKAAADQALAAAPGPLKATAQKTVEAAAAQVAAVTMLMEQAKVVETKAAEAKAAADKAAADLKAALPAAVAAVGPAKAAVAAATQAKAAADKAAADKAPAVAAAEAAATAAQAELTLLQAEKAAADKAIAAAAAPPAATPPPAP